MLTYPLHQKFGMIYYILLEKLDTPRVPYGICGLFSLSSNIILEKREVLISMYFCVVSLDIYNFQIGLLISLGSVVSIVLRYRFS